MTSVATIKTTGQGLYDVTHKVAEVVSKGGVDECLVTVFLRHTSASLVIQENADPSVQRDLETFLGSLVPESEALYTHTAEGADDMPAHIKAALTQTSLTIPVMAGQMALGTWQAIYLWEHRHAPHERELVISLSAVL